MPERALPSSVIRGGSDAGEPRRAASGPSDVAEHVRAVDASHAHGRNASPPARDAPPPRRRSGTQRALRAAGSLIAGRYRVRDTLGRGGMGTVFRVLDEPTERELALKLLGGSGEAHDADWRKLRFRREFHTMAQLAHPRIVEVYDFGVDANAGDGSVPFYTMELLDGSDLKDGGRRDPIEACRILRDVASALAFLHTRRLIHRDLAPRNVRLTADGRAKLIDFGVLATVGTCGDVSGTPPYISPENARGLPIDHRADLFGLGALAYWLLTGQNAYPARSIDELEELYRAKPRPLRALCADAPPTLEALVMSLLSLDPMARPGSAGEVIDRIGAIVGLEPLDQAEHDRNEAHGYLASAALVGRQRELDLLRRRVHRAVTGKGGATVLEAPSGTGKSRLLREVALEAQIAGATVLSVSIDAAGKGPYGLLRALGRSLLSSAAVDAKEAAGNDAAMIARVVPELGGRFGPVTVAAPAGDPGEERARLQARLAKWFLDVAARRAIAIVIDDAQRADEASAAVLAMIAHGASNRRLLLAVALRSDETERAPAAIDAIREASTRVRIRGLELSELEELVRGMFGELPHAGRLARWLARVAGGSPLHSIELLRHLVERSVLRYKDGIWWAPDDLAVADLPDGLGGAMEHRVRSLSDRARSLAEALSVHDGELTLPLCMRVADTQREEDVFVALDALLYEEVLIGSGETYRFRHDAIREALLRGLDPERRRRLHLRIGEVLLALGAVGPEREAEVGWHLLRGGDPKRAAGFLARAGRGLYEAQSFADAIPPLEAALEIHEREGGAPRVRLELRHMLVMAGAMSDRKIVLRYADETIAALRRLSGMEICARVAPRIGSLLGLLVGLLVAGVRWIVSPRRTFGPMRALEYFYVEVVYAATARSLSLQTDPLRALLEQLEPLRAFSNRILGGAYLFTENLLGMATGNWGTVRRNARTMLRVLAEDHLTPLADMDRRSAMGGVRYMLAMLAAFDQDPTYVAEIAELEGLELHFFNVSADISRIVYHRFRGEERRAVELESAAELKVVQLGSLWGPESSIEWVSSTAYGFTRDVLGLRRRIDELERRVDDGFELKPNLELARGEYHRERGELDAARACIERALALLPEDESFVRPPALCALSETLLAAGDIGGAYRVAIDAAAIAANPERSSRTWFFRAERAVALAEAAMGRVAGAAERLDRALAAAAPLASPSVCGSLHEARVHVAVLANDYPAYAHSRREVERWFRQTENAALIGRIERLPEPAEYEPRSLRVEEGGSTSVEHVTIANSAARSGSHRAVSTAILTGCKGAEERYERALELLVGTSRAARGFLFLVRHGHLELAAPSLGDEPPDGLQETLQRRIEQLAEGSTDDMTEIDWRSAPDARAVRWEPVFLRIRMKKTRAIVGAVALLGGAVSVDETTLSLCFAIARELYEAGDVTAADVVAETA